MSGVYVVDSEPVGSTIKFELRQGDVDVPFQGIVRRSDQEGMGIEFTEMTS